MEKKMPDPSIVEPKSEPPVTPEDSAPVENDSEPEEEHAQGNYFFAVKVLAVLAAIILILVILKVTGIRFSIKELLPGFIGSTFLEFL